MFFILLDKKPVKVLSPIEWDKWISRRENNLVKQTCIGDVLVSTAFTGIARTGSDKTYLFETIVYNGPYHGTYWPYETYDEAVRGHESVVKLLEA